MNKQRKHTSAPEVMSYKYLNSVKPEFKNGEWVNWYNSTYLPCETHFYSGKHFYVKLILDMASVAADLTDSDVNYQESDKYREQAKEKLLSILTYNYPYDSNPKTRKYESDHLLRYWADQVIDDEANYLWIFIFDKERFVTRFETLKNGKQKDVSEHIADKLATEAKTKFEQWFK